MLSGIKTAVQGMTIQQQKQDQIANNLANSNTTGYKKSQLFASSIEKYLTNDQLQVSAERELRADESFVDYSEGVIRQTGRDLDVAIHGSGFFTVMSQSGMQYTRDGSFSLNANGFLVTNSGEKVFGDDGFIRADREGGKVSILEDGSVMQDGQEIDKLRITDFDKPYNMVRTGANRMRPLKSNTPTRMSEGFALKQGHLEGSNVDVIEEMTAMISSSKNYEAIASALKTQDETLGKAVNQVGRVDG